MAEVLSSEQGRWTSLQISATYETLGLTNVPEDAITFQYLLLKHKKNIFKNNIKGVVQII